MSPQIDLPYHEAAAYHARCDARSMACRKVGALGIDVAETERHHVNPQIETLYQEIGRQALSEAPDVAGKLLLYAEVEDGVASADMFYARANAPVKFRFCSPKLRELVVSLWESWKAMGKPEWRALSYVIDGGRFDIDLTYIDQMNEAEDLAERRPRAVKKEFGDAAIDYSAPK